MTSNCTDYTKDECEIYLSYCDSDNIDYTSVDSYKPTCQYPYINKGFGEGELTFENRCVPYHCDCDCDCCGPCTIYLI